MRWAQYFSVKLLIPYHIHRIETVAYPLDLLAQCPPQWAMPLSDVARFSRAGTAIAR
jgi:hypothetical protein